MARNKQNKSNKKAYASTWLILLQDCVLSVLASLLAVLLVRWLSDPIPHFSRIAGAYSLCAFGTSLLGFIVTGSHRAVRRYATNRTWLLLIASLLIKEALLVVLLLFGIFHIPTVTLSVLMISADIILSLVLVLYPRYAASVVMSDNKEVMKKAKRKTALVQGTSAASIALADEAETSGRYMVAGFASDDPNMVGRVIGDHIVYLYRGPEDMENLQWRLGGIDCLLFPVEPVSTKRPEDGPDAGAPKTKKNAKSRKNASKSLSAKNGSAVAADIPVQRDGMSLVGHAFKRLFDITLSGVLLLLFSPLIAICAIAIRLEDGKPVIYRQERIGRGGEPFNILKFRSMRIDAESGQPALYSGEDDPRLTRVGKFLRQHHLDELPQLWNVFRGDMSFIGYRPERQYYIDKIMERNPRYRFLYQIRPGVTSYATLYNGYTDTLEKMLTRLDLDLYYLRNHSVMFDIRVLGLTFLSIVSGKKF